jgi:SAM-dependent methyltransferase
MDLCEINAAHQYPHPYNIARRDCLIEMMKTNPPQWVYADVGAGDQFITSAVMGLTSMAIHVVDHENVIKTNQPICFYTDVSQIAPKSIDCLLLLDVLEHTKEPHRLIQDCWKAMAYGGYMLITVPAHPFLFGRHDRGLGHYRRYTSGLLKLMMLNNGLAVVEGFPFFVSLFMVRCIQKLIERIWTSEKPYSNYWPFPPAHWITRILVSLLAFDFKVCRWLAWHGIRLPGLSLCYLCQKA